MKKIIICLLTLFSLCSCTQQKQNSLFENKEHLNIVVATDLHYYASELCDILSPLTLTLRSGSFSLNTTNVVSINELSPYALGFCLFVIS